jgi:hypothetical protein
MLIATLHGNLISRLSLNKAYFENTLRKCKKVKTPGYSPQRCMETSCSVAPEVRHQTNDLEVSRFIIRGLKQHRYNIGHHRFQILKYLQHIHSLLSK